MSSSAQSARCRDMGAFHRHYLLQRHPQECLYNLQPTTGSVLPMQPLLQSKYFCHSPCGCRCRNMGTFHRHYLLERDSQECLHNLQPTTGSVMPMQPLLSSKSFRRSTCENLHCTLHTRYTKFSYPVVTGLGEGARQKIKLE